MFTDRKKLFRTALLGSTATFAGGAVLGAGGVALAQDQDQEAAETIVITGSRIPRQDLVANSPVAVIGAEEFALTGNVQVENLLNDLPQVVPGLTTLSNNPGIGGSLVDLRGIGAQRTLVLVNGRRWMPSNLAGFAQLETIPSGMVERVEIVTGGAAAVYGSDAIGGVINFILKEDFEGLSANAQYDIHKDGDGERIYVDATMGANFADGRGNVMINVSWFKQNPIFAGDRSFASVTCLSSYYAAFFGTNTTSPFAPGDNATGICGPFDAAGTLTEDGIGSFFGSSTIPQGVIQGSRATGTDPFGNTVFGGSNIFNSTGDIFGSQFSSEMCPITDIIGPSGFGGQCNYNYAPPNYLQLPLTRTTINLAGHYAINDDIEFFLEAAFANVDIARELAPTPAVTNVNFHTSNPFLFNVTGPGGAGTTRLINQLANAACSRFGPGTGFGLTASTQTTAPTTSCGTGHFEMGFFDADGNWVATTDTALVTTSTTAFRRFTGTEARAFLRNNNNGNMTFRVQRRMLEAGARENPQDDDLFHFTVGFRGDFANGWHWETYYQYAKFRSNASVRNDIDPVRFRQAVDVRADLDANGNPIPGTGECTIVPSQQLPAAAGAAPCVPIDLFGLNALTPGMVNYIALDALTETEFEREMFGATVGGTLLELPAGPMGFSLGMEARRESGRFSPDDSFQQGVLGFNSTLPTRGRINLWEVFGELNIPLISDAFLIKYLAVDAAVRFTHYSTVGTVWTYKFGGEWRPFDDLKIRGNFNRAVRAPNISELFAGAAQSFPSYADPCNGASVGGDPAKIAACQVWFDQAGATWFPAFVQNNSQVQSQLNSNPNLTEETANTWTVGGVFTPHQIPNLELIIDYYSIVLKGGVGTQFGGARGTVSNCFDALVASPSQATFNDTLSCTRALRSPLNGQLGEASPLQIFNTNVSRLTAKGIDVQLRYNFDLEDAIGVPGTIDIQGLYTRTLQQVVSGGTDCAGFFFCGGSVGNPIPKNKVAARATYRQGAYAVSLRWTMVGSTTNVYNLYGASFPGIGTEHVLDFTFQWDITDVVTVTLGVENITNNKPPFMGIFAVQDNTDGNTFNSQLLGPRFFGRVSANF